MKRGMAMRRRDALISAAAAWVLGGVRPASGIERIGIAAPLRALTLSLFERPDCAAAVGRAYLATLPPRAASLDALSRAVLDALPSTVSPAAIRSRIRREFARGDMVAVDGWMLSVTEARVYAIATLGREVATS